MLEIINDIYLFFYYLPMPFFAFVALIGSAIWFFYRKSGYSKKYEKNWKRFNITVLVFVVIFVFAVALLYRLDKPQIREFRLRPFQFLLDASYNTEYLRLASLNTLVFMPFGLCIPELIENKYSPMKVIFLSIATAFLISFTIEITQYVFHLGKSEVDDLMLNTLGATIGTLPFFATRKSAKKK